MSHSISLSDFSGWFPANPSLGYMPKGAISCRTWHISTQRAVAVLPPFPSSSLPFIKPGHSCLRVRVLSAPIPLFLGIISVDACPLDPVMATDTQKKGIKVAAVQASPVFLNKTATTQKVCKLIREAGKNGADVIGFPETFIPGYPGWQGLICVSTEPAPSLFCKLFNEAVEVPGPETEAIGAACKEANIYAVVGINERRPNTTGTLWNTNLFFDRDGTLLHKHQKLLPTAGERVVHAPGETGSKASVLTDFGCLSSLICGENGNPLAQYSVSLDYPIVHVASWPPHFCPGQNVEDAAEVSTRSLANSLGCYVINSVAVVDDAAIEAYGVDEETRAYMRDQQTKRRATILGPGGPVPTTTSEDGSADLVFASVNVDDLVKSKYVLVSFFGHFP